tara:strand:- start:11430 stop:12353 length:924 start_codon:yes stop_codon:yes gene_type:complete
MPNKVYIKFHAGNAGKYIYEGYANAWKSLGYEVIYYDELEDIDSSKGSYHLMAHDTFIKSDEHIKKIENSYRTYVIAAPNEYPKPWGDHPNWRCHCPQRVIDILNGLDNVFMWCFGVDAGHHKKWKKVYYVPLAFDNIGYQPKKYSGYEHDICFVGGWADNGFDEKRKIMTSHFEEIQKLNLKVGIFINQNISVQDEANLLFNSKIAINLHDEYQRSLGLDVNERTFKSLGLTGFMVCDSVKEVENLFPSVPTAGNPKDFTDLVKLHIDSFKMEKHKGELEDMKKANRKNILDNHTYVNRIQQLLEL